MEWLVSPTKQSSYTAIDDKQAHSMIYNSKSYKNIGELVYAGDGYSQWMLGILENSCFRLFMYSHCINYWYKYIPPPLSNFKTNSLQLYFCTALYTIAHQQIRLHKCRKMSSCEFPTCMVFPTMDECFQFTWIIKPFPQISADKIDNHTDLFFYFYNTLNPLIIASTSIHYVTIVCS